jgi:dTMP kinase
MAETFLFMADRREHVTQVIQPALAAEKIVVCDRYIASTVAYQGFANKQDLQEIEYLNKIASRGVVPDLTIYLNIDPEVGLERAKRVERTRFEENSLEYHRAVQRGFQYQFRNAAPGSWVHIDASQSVTTVRWMVLSAVFDRLLSLGYFTDDTPTKVK